MERSALLARHDRRLPRYTSYPTAPHFGGDVGNGAVRRWLGAIAPGTRLSLYVHVPFCEQMCWFCGCNTSVVHSVGALERYAAAVQCEIERVADAIGQRLSVAHVHWGGGTPTSLPPALMRAIDRTMRRCFAFDGETEVAIEIDPRTLPETAVADFAALGIGRASLGVQDFAPAVQDAIGRHQTLEQTRAAADAARQAGATSINLDLVYGLPHQTIASLEATIAAVLTLDPDRIALFGYAHVPWMQKRQQVLAERALPDTAERFAQQDRAATLLVAAGYRRIGLDHFAKPRDRMAEAARTGRLARNFQGYTVDEGDVLLGFGASSIGALPQGYVQNLTRTADYLAAIEAGDLAVARGFALDAEDRLRRQIIERIMCDCTVDVAGLAAAAGLDVARFDAALPQLDRLAADGLLVREGWVITLPETARPFLRHAAACFDAYLDASAAPGVARHAAAI
ncbi:oxygen-independent coproporphyrinogen III oxidase [Acidiphilium sp.]|uniref:oxygen-independent coproporphyrinogen III oxidase n=1 Tax=Acidiphilium sp. TaxID=527 RepID=UPI003D0295E2